MPVETFSFECDIPSAFCLDLHQTLSCVMLGDIASIPGDRPLIIEVDSPMVSDPQTVQLTVACGFRGLTGFPGGQQ